MDSKYEVKQGLPPVKEVIELLNTAYGNWGDEKMFEWKYNYPGTALDEHHLYIFQDFKLTAFARLYHRIINFGDEQFSVVVRGNAAVHHDYQGKGQYKSLHKANEDYCISENIDFVMTFNRKDNVSFKTFSKSQWSYVELPLYLTILSPRVALKQYASSVIINKKVLNRLFSLCGNNIKIEVEGEQISLSELANKPKTKHKAITVHISRNGLHTLIGLAANNEGMGKITQKTFSLLTQNDISLFQPKKSEQITYSMGEVGVIPPMAHSDDDIVRICQLYNSTVNVSNSVHFRRNSKDIDHMLKQPNLMGTLYLEQNNKIVGFAPIYLVQTGDVKEARVSDIVYKDEKVKEEITSAIVSFCKNKEIDVIAMFSEKPLNSQWVRIRRHVLMWDDLKDTKQNIDLQHLKLGFYDVV